MTKAERKRFIDNQYMWSFAHITTSFTKVKNEYPEQVTTYLSVLNIVFKDASNNTVDSSSFDIQKTLEFNTKILDSENYFEIRNIPTLA